MSFQFGVFEKATKTILDNVSGEFRAGELSAVMGPSGAGKSTLLDVLTGYTTKLFSGTITINGRSRDAKKFRNQTAYIMQDAPLQMFITVWEAMNFAVNLKIGSQLKHRDKKERVNNAYKILSCNKANKQVSFTTKIKIEFQKTKIIIKHTQQKAC